MSEAYPAFGKIPRWDREVVITEKIDGTNALVQVAAPDEPFQPVVPRRFLVLNSGMGVAAGSRKRWISPDDDNHGFAAWVWEHAEELAKLGPGRHYGEWYGKGINRGYGLSDKRFMLFNTERWGDPATRPACCEVATTLATTVGSDLSIALLAALNNLRTFGSTHVPGYKDPEGIVFYHKASGHLYKSTLDNDDYKTREGVAYRPFKVDLDSPSEAGDVIRPTKPPMDTHPAYGGAT